MSAHEILEAFASGEREPVLGPFTHIEAVGLVSIHDKLLDALKGLVAVPLGNGAQLLSAKLLAHHKAHRAIRLATNGGPVVDVVHAVGYHSITPVCGNCQHEQRCPNGGARNCRRFGWPVQHSGTCGEHAYRPTVAKTIPIGCAV